MKEINIGATVFSDRREIGRVEQVVLDCNAYEASHLVVKHGGALQPHHVLMPIGWVTNAEHDRVYINHSEEELAQLPNFETQYYARLDQLDEERRCVLRLLDHYGPRGAKRCYGKCHCQTMVASYGPPPHNLAPPSFGTRHGP